MGSEALRIACLRGVICVTCWKGLRQVQPPALIRPSRLMQKVEQSEFALVARPALAVQQVIRLLRLCPLEGSFASWQHHGGLVGLLASNSPRCLQP